MAAGVVVSLSLANLCYLRVWDLLLHNPQRNYLTSVPYGRTDYFAALIGVTLLAGCLYAMVSLVWHHKNRWLRIAAMLGVFVVFLFPLDFVRRSSGLAFEGFVGNERYIIVVGSIGVLIALAIIFRHKFYAVLFWLLAILSPYAAFNLGHALVYIASPDEVYSPRILTPDGETTSSVSQQRLLWIIFDEWDQSMLFERRPPNVKLPVLDTLVKESVVATRAYAPAAMTLVSIPALLSGRLIAEAVATEDSRLSIRFANEAHWRNLRDQETIITDALRGFRPTAVFGWYHPYNRITPQDANLATRSFGFPGFEAIQGDGVWGSLVSQYAFLAVPIYGRMVCRDLYLQLHAEALSAVSNPKLKFMFLHYGIPHAPSIYDAQKRALSVVLRSETSGYAHNLELVDRTLGELLAALEKAGLRDSTSLILTSDHWWRTAPWVKSGQGYPVPLIIQAKAGGKVARVDAPLCTTMLRGLANAMLTGEVRDNQDVAVRLVQERTRGQIRYVNGIAEISDSRASDLKPAATVNGIRN